LIEDLRLTAVKHSVIGCLEGKNKGLSGGERKRAAIAA